MFLITPFLIVPARAQSIIERSVPEAESDVAAAPDQIGIWFAQPVADEPEAASVRVIDAAGVDQAVGETAVYPVDARHIRAPLTRGLRPGTYTVLWTARFADDGQERAGAYAFRVGSRTIPGAAPASDDLPAIWAVATRWLTLAGLSIAVGGFLVALLASSVAESPATDQRRRWLIIAGTLLALVATVAEPAFETFLDVAAPPLVAVVSAFPLAWWLRAAALLALAVLSLSMLAITSVSERWSRFVWIAGLLLGLLALAGLTFAGQAAQPGRSELVGTTLSALLQLALVLLAGVAIHLAFTIHDLRDRIDIEPATAPAAFPLRQGSRLLAIGLAVIGLIGVAAIGILDLPSPMAMFESWFGGALIIVGLVLLIALALATVAWRRAMAMSAAVWWTKAGLATLGLLAVALLALLVPPSAAAVTPSLIAVNLVTPVPLSAAGETGVVHLQYQPAAPGGNAFVVWLTNAAAAPLTPEERPDFSLRFRALDHDVPEVISTAESRPADPFATSSVDLPGPGWWQADVTVTPPTGDAATATFFLLLPDPNVDGAGWSPPSSPAAEAVFNRGLASMTALRQVRFNTHLGSGAGTFAQNQISIDTGGTDTMPAYRERSASYETIIVGDRQWLRRPGEPWTERPAGHIFLPSEWGGTYERATGFTLGPIIDVDGEPSQVVTFWLPRQDQPRQEPAWFAWWVGTESGQVRREAMISTRHYMVYNFSDFDVPLDITPPADA